MQPKGGGQHAPSQSAQIGCKVDLARDTATSDIRVVRFTPDSHGNSRVLPELPDPDARKRRNPADGAYDTRRCHRAIIDREATPLIPIRKNGRPWQKGCPAAVAKKTKPCVPPATMAVHSARAEPDTMREAGSRQRCAAARALANVSQRKTQPPNRQNPGPDRLEEPQRAFAWPDISGGKGTSRVRRNLCTNAIWRVTAPGSR